MQSLIKSIKKRIAIAKKCEVLGPEDADFQSGYQRALKEILDDFSFLNIKVDIDGVLQPIERWDGDVIVVAASSTPGYGKQYSIMNPAITLMQTSI